LYQAIESKLNAIIQANDLTKKYRGGVTAVDHVSFSVEQGEIFGFLGPNGAGKTTTIRMLTTLAAITEGGARVAGYDVAKDQNHVRRSIGLVPQEAAVDQNLSGIENLLLSAALYKVPTADARKRANELLDLVGLQEASKRLVRTYSGGMKKRLEIISGLMHEPKVLFLDEPTLGLDIQTRTAMWDHIRGINRERGMTIFLTTHYLEEADSLCGRIAIIDGGKIKVLGAPSTLKSELGTDVLEIEVSSGSQDLSQYFASLKNVKSVQRLECKYRIKLVQIEQSLQGIFNEVSRLGLRVVNTRFEKASLDQVFLETTGKSIRDDVASEPIDAFVLRAQARTSGRN
jgi:ABC-2 type transport system ATP-binding protein